MSGNGRARARDTAASQGSRREASAFLSGGPRVFKRHRALPERGALLGTHRGRAQERARSRGPRPSTHGPRRDRLVRQRRRAQPEESVVVARARHRRSAAGGPHHIAGPGAAGAEAALPGPEMLRCRGNAGTKRGRMRLAWALGQALPGLSASDLGHRHRLCPSLGRFRPSSGPSSTKFGRCGPFGQSSAESGPVSATFAPVSVKGGAKLEPVLAKIAAASAKVVPSWTEESVHRRWPI